jgi:hypothetical protein
MSCTYREIHILSGRKTASTTLSKSFTALFPNVPVFHYHIITGELELALKQKKKILIVNSYREPISRHVSSFFHYLDAHVPEIYTSPVKSVEQTFPLIEKKMDALLQRREYNELFHPFVDLPLPTLWFDPVQKYSFYSHDHMDILLLRFDAIDEWQAQIGNHFPDFRLVTSNRTENKIHGNHYKYFKEHYDYGKLEVLRELDKKMLDLYFRESIPHI